MSRRLYSEVDLDLAAHPLRRMFLRCVTACPVQAVIGSGLAFSLLRVNGFNDHPGGKFPAPELELEQLKWATFG